MTSLKQAVILVGGRGTRIAALYPDLPKPLIPLCGKPFLEHQLDWLARGGVRQVHLAAGHLPAVMLAWAEAYRHPDLELTWSVEPQPLGTGGALKFVEAQLKASSFLVLNGDSIVPNLDVGALWQDRTTHRNAISISVVRVEKAGRFGTVEFTDDGTVTAFLEKQDRDQGWVNGGVYAVDRSLLSSIPDGKSCSLENDIFPQLVQARRMRALRTPAPLLDMGTPEGLQETTAFLSA